MFSQVFPGFFSDNLPSLEDRKKMLRRAPVASVINGETEFNSRLDNWLPATIIFGEGIFLEFNEKRLKAWELRCKQSLKKHFAPLEAAFSKSRREDSAFGQELSPRFVLIHTLAHLLISRLALASGSAPPR